ncbi:tyrosine-protein phosphatase [Crassaminicella profunda]|uniref:tyrosine-protein phosphatase n=1 Tax=Crassaminicella profunda TaxID=1286698 RepID=UPI001CA75B12|nr:CpsB/CapC family capsule biosynthesis tyrosine phosphatase [Crassaminicella profunda]QZY55325.1 hypothetical protein K7H06_20395 [Crassaminicella profunda]
MIDIHCHILPGVDDGAKDLKESIEMARIAYKDGIRTIINTSHFYDTNDFVTGEQLKKKLINLQQKLKEENIDMEMLLGNEAYISPNLPELAERREVFTINHSRYLLLELPMQEIPMYTETVIYELRLKGFIPIIAHPERYAKVIEEPNIVCDFIGQGALIQVNSGSIRGRFGEAIQKTVYTLLRHNMVHLIGSDAHASKSRRPMLKKAFEKVSEITGQAYANQIFYEYPKAVIKDEDFEIQQPMEIQQRKKLSKNFFGRILEKCSLFTIKRVE